MSPSTAVLAHDGLVQFVPTAGRRIKGTHLGLCLRGAQARRLALEYVHRSWPECAQALSSTDRADRTEEPSWPVTERRKNELRGLAQSQRWFEDGNRGAHGVRKSMQNEGKCGVWSRVQAEAEALLTDDEGDKSLAYALRKAGAIAEWKGESGQSGSLERLALRAWDQGDLMASVLLAEHLPSGSVLRTDISRS